MNSFAKTIEIARNHFPNLQAMYLFGSAADEANQLRDDSDIDLAVLLPHDEAKRVGNLQMSDLRVALSLLLRREVDLINLRIAPTVLQKEAVYNGRRLCRLDEYAADEFEMLTLSFYQRLNYERREILADMIREAKNES